jgi:LuxR family maltose regulon positive regulatory protein
VAHDRLAALLPPVHDAPVVLVVAPAGYGKSTLLSEWASRATTPVIWLTLDRHLSDPASLVAHIAVATMGATGPEPSLEASLRAPSATVWSSFVPRLSTILQRSSPYLMVLDDVHSLESPGSRDVIDWLALHVPAGSQLAISGRSTEGMRLSRLRVRGEAAGIGTEDLALTDAEAQELMRSAGIDVSAREAREVNERCAGWVSGLLMAAVSWAKRPASERSFAWATSGALVTDFLDSEVLAPLPAEQCEFITRASLLRTLTAALCDEALERTDSAQQLERLCASSAFMTRLPDGSFQMHDLVRLALRARMEQAQPAACAAVNRRAALWHADHGDPGIAVKYAQRSGDRALACQLIGGFAVVELGLGRIETLMSWLDWVEAHDLIDTDPAMCDSGVHILALPAAVRAVGGHRAGGCCAVRRSGSGPVAASRAAHRCLAVPSRQRRDARVRDPRL